MTRNKNSEALVAFLNVGLTEELNARLDRYCLKRMNKNGKLRYGLKTKIARAALVEWLDHHEGDVDLDLGNDEDKS